MALQKVTATGGWKMRGYALAFFLFVSELLLADTGLVLTGGGGKGAYEVGVWKALTELGFAKDVRIISGTSVGALNAALFATHTNATECVSIWTEQVSKIGGPNPVVVKKIIEQIHSDEDLDVDLVAFFNNAVNGIIDQKPLRKVLETALPKEWSKEVPQVYVTTLEKGELSQKPWRRQVFNLNGETEERRLQMLLASSAFPLAFDRITIDGKVYVDGGWDDMGGDNTPIDPVLSSSIDVDRIIVVFLHIPNKQELKKINTIKKNSPNLEIITIAPSEKLGGLFSGVMNFSDDYAEKLIDLGYNDAMRKLRHLR